MADINVNVVLPDPITVDVTSPTQVLATNISIPGPQGPAGIQGPSGAIGPSGARGLGSNINNLTPEFLYITGKDGIIVSSNDIDTIFISGNSGYFQSAINLLTTNLNSTGANLNTSINSLSGLFTGYTGNLDNNYATDAQLENTGSTLNTKIDNLSGYVNSQDSNISNNLASTGSSLQSNINTLSSNLSLTGSNLENKINSLSGTLTGNYLTTNSASSTYATITNLNLTGNTLNSSIASLSGTLTSDYATIINLASTGSNLQNQINNLDNVYATDASVTSVANNLASTGNALETKIGSLSGTLTSNYATISDLASTGSTLVNTISSLSGTLTSTYATITNLASTGSTLTNSINSLSGTLTSTYATINNLANTGSTLATNLANTGSNLDTKINALSGSAVLLYGNQTISGLKDFTTRPTVNTTPVLLSGENANGLTVLVKNDEPATLLKGQPVYIYGANGNNILVRKASNTGEAYSSKTLGLLAQDLTSNAQGFVITEGALEGINTNAGNAGDPIWLGPTGDLIFGLAQKPYAPNHLVYLGVIERKQINNGKIYVKVQNGFELQELHNVNIDHKNVLNNNDIIRYNSASGLWFNETLNTGTFQTQINSLSGSSVLLYGDQSVGGVKTFRDNVYINNLYVTGTETIVNTNNFNVQSPYLLLNLTGGAVDGGIFFVTGAGLTGVNDNGPIIGFDHSNKFKFGVSTRNSDLSTLPDIASVQDIIAYSGVADNKFSTITNLASTGNTLEQKIGSLSGTLTSTYATISNLSSTGSTLQSNINTVASNLITTGNTLQSNINTVSSNLISTGNTLEGKISSLSGTLTSNYATITNLASTGSTLTTNLASTGSTLNSSINSLSGTLTGNYATITNLATTGSTLNTKINNLSGYINSTSSNIVFTTGNQTISGIKTFIQDTTFGDSAQGDFLVISGNNFTVYGSGNFTSGLFVNSSPVLTGSSTLYATTVNLASTGSTLDNKINNLSGVSVLRFGDQTISGVKTFIGNTNISGNLNVTGNSNIRGTLDVTGLVVSGLGTPFILKSASNGNSVYFDPTLNGNAGILFTNYVATIGLQGVGDQNLSIGYGGGGTRSLIFTKSSINRALLDSNGNFGIGSGISSVPSRFYVSGNSVLQGNLTVSGDINISGNYNLYSQIENTKKLALAYAIAL